MDITFACESCGQSIVIDEAGAGQLFDCPKCGTPVEVPRTSSTLDKAVSSSPPSAPARRKWHFILPPVGCEYDENGRIVKKTTSLSSPRSDTMNEWQEKMREWQEKNISKSYLAEVLTCPKCGRNFLAQDGCLNCVPKNSGVGSMDWHVKALIAMGVGCLLFMSGLFPIAGIGFVIIGLIVFIRGRPFN
jgi:predicted RNA-binding Zn-ribbon protein involved in translation (DUF1610 family)